MSAIGGSVREFSIRGRLFAPSADSKVTIKLGGFSNEVMANGNGTSRMKKTAEAASCEGLKGAIDHNKGDLEFLQEVTDGKEFVPFSVTLVEGSTFQGNAQLLEMPALDSEDATSELKLGFDGKITRQ